MNMLKQCALVLAATAATAAGAQAQGSDSTRAGMHAMGGMQGMCTIMSAMHEGPAAALEHADHLNLTPPQLTRLGNARATVQRAHDAAMEQSRAADRDLATAAGGERVNESAVRDAFRRMADAHAQAAAALLRGRAEVRATLNEVQRAQLAQLTRSQGGMAMGGRRPTGPDSGAATPHTMGRDSGGMMRHPMGRESATKPGRTGDSTTQGHMGMMGMMMSHCSAMSPATDSARAHRH